MTEKLKELLSELFKLQDASRDDAEIAHEDADNLLLEYIDDIDIREAFKGITRWYA